LHIGLLAGCLTASGITALADSHRSPSAEGASISFANLAAGDEVPPGYIARFTIRGMGIAPAGSQVDNTGHFHLLIDLAELPPLDQPLPATEQIVHFGKGQTEAPLNLAAGQHRLQLLLADYAHVPHDPPVMSEVVTIVVATDAE
jgi:hypothetical protein